MTAPPKQVTARTQQALLAALAGQPRNTDGWVRVALPQLATAAGVAEATARLARRALVDAGRLEWIRDGCGRGHAGMYRIR